jgi:hypothetical protein
VSEEIMQKNARKNRPKKKEIPPERWNNQFEEIQKLYAYGGKKPKEERDSAEK